MGRLLKGRLDRLEKHAKENAPKKSPGELEYAERCARFNDRAANWVASFGPDKTGPARAKFVELFGSECLPDVECELRQQAKRLRAGDGRGIISHASTAAILLCRLRDDECLYEFLNVEDDDSHMPNSVRQDRERFAKYFGIDKMPVLPPVGLAKSV